MSISPPKNDCTRQAVRLQPMLVLADHFAFNKLRSHNPDDSPPARDLQ